MKERDNEQYGKKAHRGGASSARHYPSMKCLGLLLVYTPLFSRVVFTSIKREKNSNNDYNILT